MASSATYEVSAARLRTTNNKAINENDVKVVNAFTDSFEKFTRDVAKVPEGTVPNVSSFQTLKANNDTLQSHSFKELNDEYKIASEGIQENAATAVSLAQTANTTPVSDITVDTLNDAMETYGTQITAMTSAVSTYEADRAESTKESNNIFGYVIGGIIALIILAIIINFIRVGKKVKARREALFANDPAAANIPAAKQKMLAELLENLYRFEKDYKKGNQEVMNLTRKSSYDIHYVAATEASLGKYRAIAYEYGALVAIADKNDEQARTMLGYAEQTRGDREFYTETARNYGKI